MLKDYKAILFGSIGTLVETSEIQRKAFNQAFSEAGLDWIWTPDEYNTMLKKSGGINRINDYATFRGIGVNAHELHTRKTEIFDNMINEETTTLRPGVVNLISYAIDNDIQLGFVTSTSEKNIDAIFKSLNGQIKRSDFNFIGNDKIISQPKPNSEIYFKALSELNLCADECIAIEDTEVSMRSAIDANLKCIAFPGALARYNNFSNAHLVTYSLSPKLLLENQI